MQLSAILGLFARMICLPNCQRLLNAKAPPFYSIAGLYKTQWTAKIIQAECFMLCMAILPVERDLPEPE
jgi:hypothetical protein